MRLRKFNQIVLKEDRFGFDDIDQPFDDDEAKKAAKMDLKSDPGYKKLIDDEEGEADFDKILGTYDTDFDGTDLAYNQDQKNKKVRPELTEEQEDVIRELTYLLRKMIKNSGIDNFYVTNDGYDISIQFIFNKLDKMKSIIRVTDILKKINNDILIQYDPEIEMWETTKAEPMLTIDFYYDANKKGSEKNVNPFG